jgi:hypothetical protein
LVLYKPRPRPRPRPRISFITANLLQDFPARGGARVYVFLFKKAFFLSFYCWLLKYRAARNKTVEDAKKLGILQGKLMLDKNFTTKLIQLDNTALPPYNKN